MTNFRALISGTLGGSLPWSTGLWLTASVAEGTLSASWAARVNTLWTTATNGLQNFMSADVEVTGTSVSTLNATMHQTTKTTASAAISGTDANASLPWNIAEVVTTRSALATKYGHGRMFLPPFAEDQVVAHVIKSATITSMETVFNAFFAGLVADGATPFLFNKRARKDGTPPFTITPATYYDLSNKPAQQRRRVSKIVPARVVGTF